MYCPRVLAALTPRRIALHAVPVIAGALLFSPANAADVTPAALAAGCSACHGPLGRSPGAIPSVKGLETAAIRSAMLAYKKDELQGTVMNRIAKGFSNEEIDALAIFLSGR